jgi:hypothetical protein
MTDTFFLNSFLFFLITGHIKNLQIRNSKFYHIASCLFVMFVHVIENLNLET